MNDIVVFTGLVAGWVILNVWVLPMFGIQTCMSGACSRTSRPRQPSSPPVDKE